MAEFAEELEPLFDYRRVQPLNFVCLDDDDSSDSSSAFVPKRQKNSDKAVKNDEKNAKDIQVIDCEDKEEDWLPSPPRFVCNAKTLEEDSTIKELRLKKQELVSFAQSAQDVLQAVEESMKRDIGTSLRSSFESVVDQSSKPRSERAKIVISIQDKDGLQQFRVYMDDIFERLFKMYADKVKMDIKSLAFIFDGDKISPTATPVGLGMEDDDIIEVHVKSS